MKKHQTPEHDRRYPSDSDMQRSVHYVTSIITTADDPDKLMWHGWALREAFLAGVSYQKQRGINEIYLERKIRNTK